MYYDYEFLWLVWVWNLIDFWTYVYIIFFFDGGEGE